MAVERECQSEAKRAMTDSVMGCDDVSPSSSDTVPIVTSDPSCSSSVQSSVARIPLPLLSSSVEAQYRAQRMDEATALVWNCDTVKCDEPLQLRLPVPSWHMTVVDDRNRSLSIQPTDSSKQTCMIGKNNAFTALIAAYESSDTEEL